MIARPVRLAHQARTRLPGPDAAPVPAPEAIPSVLALGRTEAMVARLEGELGVMKAVVRVQRQEIDSLRAQRRLLTESSPDDDVRATRERWAALVDSLIARPC
ncbi:hypothetical protein [Methylobacterium sp. J-076]|uniref:hypothetical protein n=1 Tax=Methylobacterium sp. J-076 TaxID=2836655 RepID=UPI001FBA8CC0|nr:hypothetical protein [Methylobacterium sp. J-076]MCJ2012575.1 hypothetical protein [Methylobacterium sp. J-076]